MNHEFSTTVRNAKAYWTDEKISRTISPKKLFLSPREDAAMIIALDLMNKDASMTRRHIKKFLQINHMLGIFIPLLDDLIERFSSQGEVLKLCDIGCGHSYLSLLMAYFLKFNRQIDFILVGIDRNPRFIEASRIKAQQLRLDDVCSFIEGMAHRGPILEAFARATPNHLPQDQEKIGIHFVWVLHACDTATDTALQIAVQLSAEYISVAPCCQNELYQSVSAARPTEPSTGISLIWPLLKHAQIRREVCADITDSLRALYLERHGYQTTVREFVAASHTPKNRLISGRHTGNEHGNTLDEIHKMLSMDDVLRMSLFRSCDESP
jgi:hypothetical protein